MARRITDWATLAATSPLMVAGLVVVALSPAWGPRCAGIVAVLGASAALAAPLKPLRLGGLTVAVMALCLGLRLAGVA